MAASDMQATMMEKQMTLDQQAKLLDFTRIGLKWIAGQISFDDVTGLLGKPLHCYESNQAIDCTYYPDKVMWVTFSLDKLHPVNSKPSIRDFRIKVEDLAYNVHTDIPLENFDHLGLYRIVHGETIDGVRTENSDFFLPNGIIDPSGFYPDNYVSFGYRLPLPPDSLFDVYASFYYLGEWAKPTKERGATLDNLRVVVDLRNVAISRHYLTPEELEQRRLAKRQKYGMMDLRTGMVCPETGMWEGWTQAGLVGKALVQAGDRFGQVLQPGAPSADARWMWSGLIPTS
ncbi:hypothetical protein [Paraburkholderia sp.]|uniref:hypothetical protein n=1 Tax=Paraburkholderia sp. TaxID=1926495 RepID=UPI0039E2151A